MCLHKSSAFILKWLIQTIWAFAHFSIQTTLYVEENFGDRENLQHIKIFGEIKFGELDKPVAL